MATLIFILGVSFVLCVGLTPIVRAAAARAGLVDRPDGLRKMDRGPVPLAGGVAVFLSGSIVLVAACTIANPLTLQLAEQARFLVGLLLSGATICLVGLADDRWGLRARYKLLGQFLAVAVVMNAGLMVRTIRLFDWEIDLGLLAIPFTAFWLLGAINSLNLLDGMDGLLGSVGAVISAAMAAMAVLGDQWVAACVAVALTGALIGFLCFNWPPASVFLGDSGSMLIGLVIGVLGIHGSLKSPATIALTAPVAMLAIPIFDTTVAIIRRKLTGRSVSSSDRDHLHHCLLRRGYSNGVVLTFVSFACLATGIGALASLTLKNELFAIFSAAAVAGTFVATRLFGHVELRMMKDRLLASGAALIGRASREPRPCERDHIDNTAAAEARSIGDTEEPTARGAPVPGGSAPQAGSVTTHWTVGSP
jgi:UDP-GlcNAc:undecaprenyl-phosphate GlcNAc-1-phosphate transferase